MPPVRDLDAMLAGMSPALDPETYVFATTPTPPADVVPLMAFREEEGVTLVLTRAEAESLGVPADPPMARIVLRVHSALDGVGLTAAVSGELAAAGIACNVVAAFHHDHLFVPAEHAATAVERLAALSARHASSSP